jgi:hypothetical protein
MVLELAVAAGCRAIVTYNLGDFLEANKFEHGSAGRRPGT